MKIKIGKKKERKTNKQKHTLKNKTVSLNALGTVLHRVSMGWLHFN